MNDFKRTKRKGVGRLPVIDPAVYRYSISLNGVEHNRFLSLYERSGAANKARFITSCIFDKPFKVVEIDKARTDYYMRLTTFFDQFRAIGHNYNQLIKLLHSNFGEKKALAFLYKLEKETIELVRLNKKIIDLTQEFEQKHL